MEVRGEGCGRGGLRLLESVEIVGGCEGGEILCSCIYF